VKGPPDILVSHSTSLHRELMPVLQAFVLGRQRYGDDSSTHPNIDLDLWLEAGSSGGPDKNQVYELFNTTTENLWMACSVSTIGCSQSIPST
jgi:hypothetical protein